VTFTEHCAKEGINLLKDDINFIRQQIKHMTREQARQLVRDYIATWQEGMAEEPSEIKKQNKGRMKANLWLIGSLR
jgi:hypothetical protein